MKRNDVIKYFWEELNAYTLNNHRFNDGFKRLVNASIERAIIRSQNKGKTIANIYSKSQVKNKVLYFGKVLEEGTKEYDLYMNGDL